MPLYEYQCDACEFRFEVIQRYSDPPVEKCQSCGGAVRKLLSSPAIQFKGSGWYITDYARKGMKDASESDSPDASGSKGSAAADKPAAGTDAGGSSAKASTTAPTSE
jgi:putative FmdB family regulatory protein